MQDEKFERCVDSTPQCKIIPWDLTDKHVIWLPIRVTPVWSHSSCEYCVCVCHGKLVTEEWAQLCLIFSEELQWYVGIGCTSNESTQTPGVPIIAIADILHTLIIACIASVDYICNICERKRCKDPDCAKVASMIKRRPIIDVFEHFYLNKLNVISPICDPVCVVCGSGNFYKSCGGCKRMQYCGKICRKKHRRKHKCEPFEAIWRQIY